MVLDRINIFAPWLIWKRLEDSTNQVDEYKTKSLLFVTHNNDDYDNNDDNNVDTLATATTI